MVGAGAGRAAPRAPREDLGPACRRTSAGPGSLWEAALEDLTRSKASTPLPLPAGSPGSLLVPLSAPGPGQGTDTGEVGCVLRAPGVPAWAEAAEGLEMLTAARRDKGWGWRGGWPFFFRRVSPLLLCLACPRTPHSPRLTELHTGCGAPPGSELLAWSWPLGWQEQLKGTVDSLSSRGGLTVQRPC